MHKVIMPNLPRGRVENVLIGRQPNRHIPSALTNMGIKVIEADPCTELSNAVSAHADLLYHHLGEKYVVAYKPAASVKTALTALGFDVLQAQSDVRAPYPYDVALDAARVADYLICNPLHTDSVILEYADKNHIDIVNVKQGYAKCSVCIIDEHSLITADNAIAKAAGSKGLDVLLIRNGFIELEGLDYGFIGGCCGKTAHDTICFTGDLKTHPDYQAMFDFMRARGVTPVSLCAGPLKDIGGIIPLTER